MQWVNENVDKSEESGMPGAGVEPYSRAGGKSVESCCLCIAYLFFGFQPSNWWWTCGCCLVSKVQSAGESTNMVESAGNSVPVYLILIFRVISSSGQL